MSNSGGGIIGLLLVIAGIAIIASVVDSGNKKEYVEGYERGYGGGRKDGQMDGFYDGIRHARATLARKQHFVWQ